MYFSLLHGRKHYAKHMPERGPDGPIFAVARVHSTYLWMVRLDLGRGEWAELETMEGLVYYGGMFYGDFSVGSELAGRDRARLVEFEENRATPPVTAAAQGAGGDEVIYAIRDAGVMCPECEAPTTFEVQRGPKGQLQQLHFCLDRACQFQFIAE